VQLMEHVTKLPLVATDPREVLTIGFSERADQRIAVFAADFASLVAVSSVNSHSDSPGFEAMWPRPLVWSGGTLCRIARGLALPLAARVFWKRRTPSGTFQVPGT